MIVAGKYDVDKEIGKGSFATVYKGQLIEGGSGGPTEGLVAIKAVSRSKLKNKKLLENLEIEIAILKKINHSHVVKLIDCVRTSTDFYLIMEYCALGDLTFLIKRRQELIENHPLLTSVFEKFPPPSQSHNGLHRAFVMNYLQQLTSALHFLRSKNLVHRDIKPQNLLLSAPFINYHDAKTFKELGFVGVSSLPILKIADFGFARFLPNTSLAETLCGSPLYMAPEILNYQKYNAKADLWSVGTVLYEMCCGKPPFKASNHLELFKKIKKANDVIQFPADCEVESEMTKLICALLTFDPVKRIGFQDFFSNVLVNEDLTKYELNDSVYSELESKSKKVVENNMFISEYLSSAKPKDDTITPEGELHFVKSDKKKVPVDNPLIKLPKTNFEVKSDSANSKTYNPSSSSIEKKNYSSTEVILEKDYVVVEKKSVEVNAFADEIAQVGHSDNYDHPPINKQNKDENLFSKSPMLSNNDDLLQMNRLKTPRNSITSNGSTSSRRPSLVDRRLSISSLNPSNALSKALGIASVKLFGNAHQTNNLHAINYKIPTMNSQIFQDVIEKVIMNVDNLEASEIEEINGSNITKIIESLTAKSFVVYLYAEVKYSQITSSGKQQNSIDNDLFNLNFNKKLSEKSNNAIEEDEEGNDAHNDGQAPSNKPRTLSTASQNSHDINELSPEQLYELLTETIVLYMKALSILAKAMKITSNWWYDCLDKNCSLKLNLLIQLIRDKFNDCLDKANLLRQKLASIQDEVVSNGKQNITSNDKKENTESKEDIGASKVNIIQPVYLEKLLYDRALEISKVAANVELQGEQLHSCELAYATSLWMLQTLFDNVTDEGEFNEYSIRTSNTLDEADMAIVKKYINSIANRLNALRRKI